MISKPFSKVCDKIEIKLPLKYDDAAIKHIFHMLSKDSPATRPVINDDWSIKGVGYTYVWLFDSYTPRQRYDLNDTEKI